MNDRQLNEWESGQAFAKGGPLCACRDLDCSCQVEGIPEYAKPAQEPVVTSDSLAEAHDLILDLLREVNRLAYPMPRAVTLKVNALEDYLRRAMPTPF